MTTISRVGGPDLIGKIRSLPAKRQRALTALLKQQGIELPALDSVPVVPRSADEPVRLSFTQQRLWFLAQLDGPSAAYNIPMAVRLRGDLDRPALVRALEAVVARHEVLRTRFVDREGVPYQQIGDGRDFAVSEEELADPAQLSVLCGREATTPFDLERDQLIRMRLLRLAEQEHVLLVTMHHSVSDGWSIGIFTRDLTALYEAFRAGRPSPLDPLPLQYADYTHWQRRWLADEVQARQVEYWKTQLAGVDPTLTLPADRERPPAKTYRGAREEFPCPPELLAGLREVAGRHDATLYMTLLAAYAVVLHRCTGQTDVAVGTVVANRNRLEVEQLIGFFANTLVMRADLADDPAFAELLARVKKTALEAYDHQDVPFEAVVDALQLERSLSHSPVFQTMFVLQEARTEREYEVGGLDLSPVEFDLGLTKFDLTLELRETPDGLAGTVEYNTDLYDRDTIRRFVGHYTELLASVVADPGARVSRLGLLGAAERHQILHGWNDSRSYADDRCLHQWFEDVAASTPDAVAVVCEGRTLSYGELNARANRLARHLRELGVGPETLVALCLPRTEQIVVSLLAVLKAGGAYVPLDVAVPVERLGFVLRDSAPRVLLVDGSLPEGLETPGIAVVDVRADSERWSDRPSGDLAEVGSSPADLAYVIYTSGSTGTPKGVMVEHRNVTRLFTATDEWFSFGADDVWTLFHSFAFDFSVWEIWGALLHGGRLVVVPQEVTRNPKEFYGLLCENGVTVLNQTPSAFQQLIAVQGEDGSAHRLRAVVFGGEALNVAALKPWMRRAVNRDTQLVNMYGITETTVHVTYRLLAEADAEDSASPIGCRIPDLRLYVLDGHGEPVPVGVTGELHVGGDGVARGYLNRPELTTERFLPDPFSGTPDARMYRSGDLVRQLPDGTLEYLGRGDDQVKIRGFRIELGEIEARISEHPAVRSCAVVAREDQPGNKQLVAYVVLAEDLDYRTELARHVERTLPEYMIPGAFVALQTLPLTANGKLDRKALPAPGIDAYAQRAYVAPNTRTERLLASVWAGLLGFDEHRVSADDNFFALGGHSLLITVLVARLKELGVDVSVRAVFGTQTLAGLAAHIDEAETGAGYRVPPNLIPEGCERITPEMLPLVDLTQEQVDSIVATVPGGAPNVQDVYPLASAQEGILFHHLLDPDNDPYLVSTLYVAEDEAACAAFTRALQTVIDRHDVMRTAVLTADLPLPVQVVHRTAQLAVERTRLKPGQDAEQQARALLNRPQRMALHQAPLLRLLIAEDPDSARRHLLLTAHHLIEDATSLRLTVEELAIHLAVRAELLAPPAPYRDFVAHTLHQQETDDGEAYFRAVLGDVTEPTTPFGLTNVRGGGVRRVRKLRRSLPQRLTDDLRAQAQRLHTSPACLFHTAWACVVAACSGRDDVVFGTVLSGRLQGVPGVERMLGNFINTLPLRARLAGRTVRDLIAEVDSGLKELIAREHSPLSLAQRCSGVDGDAPLFSAVANFRHFEPGHGEAAATRIDDQGVRFLAAADGINYPVSVSMDDFGTELSLDLLIDEEVSCEAVADYVETALAGIVASLAADDGAGTRALDVDVLPAAERRRLLIEWNDTQADVAAPTLMAAFEAQVEHTPDRTALIFEDETLTYAELNTRANRLAHWLIERGAGPGHLVAVHLPRSFDLVTAIYGVLKAGAAYLPIDPDLPQERVEQLLADGKPLLVLEELPDTSGHPQPDPGVAVSGDDTAYVLYTSGSSGRPKGVVISHRAGLNWIAWDHGRYGMGSGDRMLLKTSIGFDVSVPELFWPLQAGASLVIARPGGQRDPEYLARLIQEQRVTDVNFVPSMLAEFLKEPAAAGCTSLRRVEAAGEALPVELARRFARVLPGTELHNLYGPTEAGGLTAWQYRDEPGTTSVPIGEPGWNTQVYVLDSALRPAPRGVPGELYLAGAQLADGYLNQPELTRERFVPNPFDDDPDARMYRTGDLVRWRPDGVLEYLGRIDDQVKVRGFRVEPGEIETALCEQPSVLSAVVVPRKRGSDNTLVAYVCLASASDPSMARQLKQQLSARLPDYMVPGVFVFLDELPVTRNGKVDKRALPAPSEDDMAREAYVAPRTELQRTFCRMVEDVLGLSQVGLQDTFFDLGGHSLLATRLTLRVRRELGTELPLQLIFRGATVEEMAAVLETATVPQTVPLVSAGGVHEAPLSLQQKDLWFLNRHDHLGTSHDNVELLLEVDGPLDRAAFTAGVQALVARHPVLRTSYVRRDCAVTQRVNADTTFDVPITEITEAAVAEWLRAERARPFSPDDRHMIRVHLLALSEHEHVVAIIRPWGVFDGWSVNILMRELAVLYQGGEARLPELSLQYADFARWQRDAVDDAELERQREYWRRQLEGLPACVSLLTDYRRAPVKSYQGSSVELQVGIDLLTRLKQLSQERGATLYMTLLSAFAVLLGGYSDDRELAIGTAVTNRPTAELDQIVGYFVNLLVTRLDVAPDRTFADVLAQARQVTAEAHEHKDLPFADLVEALVPAPDPAFSPLFQVMFNLLPAASGDDQAADVVVRPMRSEPGTAKFDLNLVVIEAPTGLHGHLEYSADLFARRTAEHLARSYEQLLDKIVSAPEADLTRLQGR